MEEKPEDIPLTDQPRADNFGVVVGWKSEDLGGKIVFKLQSVQSASLKSEADIKTFHYFLTKNQAAVMANYLFEVSGQSPPRRHKRSWLDRLLGR